MAIKINGITRYFATYFFWYAIVIDEGEMLRILEHNIFHRRKIAGIGCWQSWRWNNSRWIKCDETSVLLRRRWLFGGGGIRLISKNFCYGKRFAEMGKPQRSFSPLSLFFFHFFSPFFLKGIMRSIFTKKKSPTILTALVSKIRKGIFIRYWPVPFLLCQKK